MREHERRFAASDLLFTVTTQRLTQLLLHIFNERFRFDHNHVWPMPQDIHDEFARVSVWNLKLVAPILQPLPMLLRMPYFVRHPPCPLICESQHRHFVSLSPEDSIRTRVVRIVFYLAGPFGLSMPSPGDGESGARARLAFRILRLEPFDDDAKRRRTPFRAAPKG